MDIAIGATRASPIGDRYSFRDMGFMPWSCVVSINHPLAQMSGLISDQQLRLYPSLCLEDTSRYLPTSFAPIKNALFLSLIQHNI